MKADTRHLEQFAADLADAHKDLSVKLAKTTGAACNGIKKDVQKRWSGIPHLPHLPRAITYSVKTLPHGVTGEVGADHSRLQGKLAWIPEYGSPTSAPRPGFGPAADREVPVWIGYVEKAAAEVFGDR